MAGALAFSPMAASTADAGETVRFGEHNMMGQEETSILLRAKHSSTNGVTLLVRTTDRSVWPVAFNTALDVAREGYPVSLVLAADGQHRLDIYAQGQRTGFIPEPVGNEQTATAIRDGMIHGYNSKFGPLDQSK